MVPKISHPPTAAVQRELEKINRSPTFISSPSLRRLLSYIVDRSLQGRSEGLKEYTLAVEVFGRPSSFDPRLDPIVRVQASNLRSKLKAYYSESGRDDTILIDIPRGTYECRFITQRQDRAASSIARSARPGSIAVLACADLSPEQDQEYFCDGITEEIIHVLSQVQQIRVAGRTSVFRYKGRLIDARKLGERLGVQSVLETSCRTDGNRIRLTAHLIDVSSGFARWSRIFTAQREQIFAVQEEIAKAIAQALCGPAVSNAIRRPAVWPSGNVETYNRFLLAKHHLGKREEVDVRKGLSILEQLRDREAENGQVLTSLADCYLSLALAGTESPKTAMTKTEQFANQAISAGDSLAEAHACLGSVMALYRWDWVGAEREFKLALELDSDNVMARIRNATFCLMPTGRIDEAVIQLREAVKLDPLSIAANQMLVWGLIASRRYDDAIHKCTQLVEMEPCSSKSHALLGVSYTLAGLHREGMRRAARALRLPGSHSFLPNWAAAIGVYSIAGARSQALRVSKTLQERAAKGITSSYWQAVAQGHLGDGKAAIRFLKEAISMKDPWVTAAGYDPLAEALRKQPQFPAIVAEVGLAGLTN